MPHAQKIFIDSDAIIAATNKRDKNHKQAIALLKSLAKSKTSLITSNFVFGEIVTVVSQKLGLSLAVRVGYDLQRGKVDIIDIGSEHREKALKKFSKQTTKNARFTDMINMVLMDELKIDTIFSFDEHYKKNGYKLLV